MTRAMEFIAGLIICILAPIVIFGGLVILSVVVE